jgi:hypothetical protein
LVCQLIVLTQLLIGSFRYLVQQSVTYTSSIFHLLSEKQVYHCWPDHPEQVHPTPVAADNFKKSSQYSQLNNIEQANICSLIAVSSTLRTYWKYFANSKHSEMQMPQKPPQHHSTLWQQTRYYASLYVYRFELTFGFYVMEPWERVVTYLILLLLASLAVLALKSAYNPMAALLNKAIKQLMLEFKVAIKGAALGTKVGKEGVWDAIVRSEVAELEADGTVMAIGLAGARGNIADFFSIGRNAT